MAQPSLTSNLSATAAQPSNFSAPAQVVNPQVAPQPAPTPVANAAPPAQVANPAAGQPTAWAPGMPAPNPGDPNYASYQNYLAGQANAGAAANAAGTRAANVNNPTAVAANPVVAGQQAAPNAPFNPFAAPQLAAPTTGTANVIGSGPSAYTTLAPGYDPTLGGTNQRLDPNAATAGVLNYSGGNQISDEPTEGYTDPETYVTSHARRLADYTLGGDTSYLPTQAAIAQNIGIQGAGAQNTIGQAASATGAGANANLGSLAQATGLTAADDRAAVTGQAGALNAFGGTQVNLGDQTLADAGNNLNALTNVEATEGPSAAQAQLQSGTNKSLNNALAIARSGRGNNAQAVTDALRQNASTTQDVSNQAAALRAQETNAYRTRQAQNLATAATTRSGLASNLYGQGLQAGQSALSGLSSQGATDVNASQAMGAQLQAGGSLQLQGLGAQAAGQSAATSDLYNAQNQGIGLNQFQTNADIARENMVSQDYGIHSGVGIAGQQAQATQTGAIVGAVASGLGMMAMSDIREKENIKSLDDDTLLGSYARTGAYKFDYSNPKFGGKDVIGTMAQDLEKTPLRHTVKNVGNRKMVDTAQLTMSNTAALGQVARKFDKLDKLSAKLDALIKQSKRAA